MTQQVYRRGQRDPEFARGDEVLCLIQGAVFRGKVVSLFFCDADGKYHYYCFPVRACDPGFMATEEFLSSAEDEDESAEGLVTA